MNCLPSQNLTHTEIKSGLKFIVKEGAAAEIMSVFTGGTFLVALAILLKATNFQVGLLASLPTLTNVFQLIAIWLVKKYPNRRMICVICSFLARVPLLVVGFLPLIFAPDTALLAMFFLLFLSYLFASISGASWNSWMKDLVPADILGSYFSRRSRIIQILNVTLSLLVALALDYVKKHHPGLELSAYIVMFLIGGAVGMVGVFFLSRASEPASSPEERDTIAMLSKPLKDRNFKNLLTFNAAYTFAINMALPFYVVYMIKTLQLPLVTLIVLGLLAKTGSILSLKLWGTYSDRYSNKTIIVICGPTFVVCILSWAFTGLGSSQLVSIAMLAIIHIVSGASAAGIDLSMNNMVIKLAPKSDAIAYMSTRNMVVAVFSSLGPICGGLLADFISNHQLLWSVKWTGAGTPSSFDILNLNNSNCYFVAAAILAALSLNLLKNVKEEGEVDKKEAMIVIRKEFRGNLQRFSFTSIHYRITHPVIVPAMIRRISSIFQ
jgi:MFS family permease